MVRLNKTVAQNFTWLETFSMQFLIQFLQHNIVLVSDNFIIKFFFELFIKNYKFNLPHLLSS